MVAHILKVGFIKGGSAVLGFLLTASIVKLLDVNSAGAVLYFLGFIPVLIVLFRFGLSNIILRGFSSEGVGRGTQALLNNGFTLSVVAPLIIISIMPFFIDDLLSSSSKLDYKSEAYIFMLCIPMIAGFTLISFAFQAQRSFFLSAFMQNLGISLFSVISIGVLLFLLDTISSLIIALVYFCATAIVFIYAIFSWYIRNKRGFKPTFIGMVLAIQSGRKLWLAGTITVFSQWSGLIIGGSYLLNSEVALLGFVQRAALLITFLLMISDTVIAPNFAKFWGVGDKNAIKHLARNSSRLLMLVSIPIFMLIFFFGERFLLVFDFGNSNAFYCLVIISFGQLINTSTGSIGFLINMTGHDEAYRNLTVISSFVVVALSFILIIEFGVVGAAVSMAISSSLFNILGVFWIKKNLGFWPIG